MLAYLPTDFPLKLEHICLSHSFHNLAALAPYIRTLTSISLGDPSMLSELLRQSIFPPTTTLTKIDQCAIEYLDRHPRIVSLTIYTPCHESLRSALMRILCRHSKTLIHLGIFSLTLCHCIDQTENELAFPQCTNLKQLFLYYHKHNQQKKTVPLSRSLDSCHILNMILTGNLIAFNCAPSELTYAGSQPNLGLRNV